MVAKTKKIIFVISLSIVSLFISEFNATAKKGELEINNSVIYERDDNEGLPSNLSIDQLFREKMEQREANYQTNQDQAITKAQQILFLGKKEDVTKDETKIAEKLFPTDYVVSEEFTLNETTDNNYKKMLVRIGIVIGAIVITISGVVIGKKFPNLLKPNN